MRGRYQVVTPVAPTPTRGFKRMLGCTGVVVREGKRRVAIAIRGTHPSIYAAAEAVKAGAQFKAKYIAK
jgi:hypothetical protein